MNAGIYGLCKVSNIPIPPKSQVTQFIEDQFNIIDKDGSGYVDFAEYEAWLNQSREIQDFILLYTGV